MRPDGTGWKHAAGFITKTIGNDLIGSTISYLTITMQQCLEHYHPQLLP